jgi:hypothetical protein
MTAIADTVSEWVDLEEAPRKPAADTDDWTLTISADEREGRLGRAAAAWLRDRCAALGADNWRVAPAGSPARVRIQRNVLTGAVGLLASVEPSRPGGPITVRTHRGGDLPLRLYTIRLARRGLVRPKQVIRLRPDGDRLMLTGVKVAK